MHWRGMSGRDAAERWASADAHPDLAGKLARPKRLTRKHAGASHARLDALPNASVPCSRRLKQPILRQTRVFRYHRVKGSHKDAFLRQFETRIANATEDEFTTAMRAVERMSHRPAARGDIAMTIAFPPAVCRIIRLSPESTSFTCFHRMPSGIPASVQRDIVASLLPGVWKIHAGWVLARPP